MRGAGQFHEHSKLPAMLERAGLVNFGDRAEHGEYTPSVENSHTIRTHLHPRA